ncbi:hypothetical protein V6Z12_A05G276000 [Gossypium hirsutum]
MLFVKRQRIVIACKLLTMTTLRGNNHFDLSK